MPLCGALSLLQKDAALQGGSSKNRCRLNVKLRLLRACVVTGACFCTAFSGPIRGPSQLFVCASVLRSLPPAAPPASPVAPALAHARGMLGRVLYAAAFFLLLIYTMDSQPTDKVEGVGDDFVRGGQDETPIKPRRNSRQRRIVVSAGTPTVIVTAGNEQFCAPWTAESPGGTVTTSAYNEDGKKRCLSAEGGSGDPRKTVLEQNKTFKRADRKSGGLDLEEIRAEAHKRQKEMGDAARAALPRPRRP